MRKSQNFSSSHYRLSFVWNCGWLPFQERNKLNFQKVVRKQRDWHWFFPQNITFFVSVSHILVYEAKHGTVLQKNVLMYLFTKTHSRYNPPVIGPTCMHLYTDRYILI